MPNSVNMGRISSMHDRYGSGCKILSWKNSRGETTWEMNECIRGKYQKGYKRNRM
jgi:hypothetical protein